MGLGGLLAINGGLRAGQENTIQWRGAVDAKTLSFLSDGASGVARLLDSSGDPIAGAENIPAIFRRAGWYEATLPETVKLIPDKTYTIEFDLVAPSGTVDCRRCKCTVLPSTSGGSQSDLPHIAENIESQSKTPHASRSFSGGGTCLNWPFV